jgi:ABC-type dipeptide/oligopeptide/nickel transport system permease subunit
VKRLWKSVTFWIGGALVLLFVLAALIGPMLYSADPLATDVESLLISPGRDAILGTDALGRDILARVLVGARVSLGVGVFSRLIALVLGGLAGLVAGYFGGRLDSILMRMADLTLAFPALLLLIAVVAAFGPSLITLFLALGVLGWAPVARVIRSRVLLLRRLEYIEAAHATGAGTMRILFAHILPGCTGTFLVLFSMGLATAIIAEGSLSFLGLGAQPPTASWGTLIRDGFGYLRTAPWLTLVPGIVMASAVLGFNLLGDALRDAADPRGLPGRSR